MYCYSLSPNIVSSGVANKVTFQIRKTIILRVISQAIKAANVILDQIGIIQVIINNLHNH